MPPLYFDRQFWIRSVQTRLLSSQRNITLAMAHSFRTISLLVCFMLPLVAHYYALSIPIPLNVDEAQWTASARTILTDPVVWRSSDLTTSGPLNGMVIAWPYAFGHIPSLYTSRLTGLILQGLALLVIASIIPRWGARLPAIVATASACTFIGCTTNTEYIHYSSELLSIALISLFAVIYTHETPHNRSWPQLAALSPHVCRLQSCSPRCSSVFSTLSSFCALDLPSVVVTFDGRRHSSTSEQVLCRPFCSSRRLFWQANSKLSQPGIWHSAQITRPRELRRYLRP